MVYKGSTGSSSIIRWCRYDEDCNETRSRGVEVRGRQLLLPRGLFQAATVLDDEVDKGGREAGLDDERATLLGRPEFSKEPRHSTAPAAATARSELLPRVRHRANRRSWRGQRIGDLICNKGSHALLNSLLPDINQYKSITVEISTITA